MEVTVTTILFGLPEGQRLLQVDVPLPSSSLTVRDLIAHKVTQEVSEVAAQQRSGMSGEYLSPEALIRAPSLDTLAPGKVEAEVTRAQLAFVDRAYMIVIDDQRIWDPDTTIAVEAQTRIEFIKILPLVGG